MARQNHCHVLALSGGGYRGLYTTTVLAGLEKQIGEPIARKFDLICGTSIGGILALGLAMEIPADELSSLFTKYGAEIFGQKGLSRFIPKRFQLSSNHREYGLHKILKAKFGDKRMGDLKHRVLIPTINFSKGSGQFFKTPHHPDLTGDWDYRIVDVALATSTTFIHQGTGCFIDGGLVGNAPGLFGLHEAKQFLGYDEKNIHLLGIGTLSQKLTKKGLVIRNGSIFNRNEKLISSTIAAQETSTDFILKHQLGENYYLIDDELSTRHLALDSITPNVANILIEQGDLSVESAFSTKKILRILTHHPSPPIFYSDRQAVA